MKTKLLAVIVISMCAFSLESVAATSTTTFRDSQGRTTGSATTNSQGQTTYRDSQGRTVGTSQRR